MSNNRQYTDEFRSEAVKQMLLRERNGAWLSPQELA